MQNQLAMEPRKKTQSMIIDPEYKNKLWTCSDGSIHPGYSVQLHKKIIEKSNELLEFRDKTFSTENPDYLKYYGTVVRYFAKNQQFFESENIINPKDASFSKGLLILGSHGVGKTFLFHVLHQLSDEIQKYGNAFSFTSTLEVVELYNQFGSKGINSFLRGQRYFDDLGCEEQGSHFGKSEIFKLLIHRRHDLFTKQGVKTFATSNLSRDELSQRYGPEIESRLHEMFNIIYADGPDRRKT